MKTTAAVDLVMQPELLWRSFVYHLRVSDVHYKLSKNKSASSLLFPARHRDSRPFYSLLIPAYRLRGQSGFSLAFHLPDLCEPLYLIAVENKMVNTAVKYFMGVLMIIDFLPDALSVYMRVSWEVCCYNNPQRSAFDLSFKAEGGGDEY